MDKEIADYAVDYAKGKKVQYAEIRANSQQRDTLSLRDGNLEAYGSAVDSGFCVRIMADGGIGFASTNKWTKEEAREIVDLAYRYARSAKRREKLVFAEEKGVKTRWTVDQKKRSRTFRPKTGYPFLLTFTRL